MGFCDISVPSSMNSPVAPFTCPVIALNKVVFPAPLEPIRPVTPPAGISKETPSTAFTPPKATAASRTIRFPLFSEDESGARYEDVRGEEEILIGLTYSSLLSSLVLAFLIRSPSHSNIPTSPSGAISVSMIRVPP